MRNFAESPEKKVKEAATKTKEAVIVAEKAAEKAKKADIESLSVDDLNKVVGGDDPFSTIPRVEPEPIDEELRKDS